MTTSNSNSKIHGIIDYTISIVLFLSPWLFGFQEFGVPSAVVMISGSFILAMSLFTNYEFSLQRLFDFQTHRNIVLIFGLFIAASPWLLNFKYYTSMPHLVQGVILIVFALASSLRPYDSQFSRTAH